MELGIPLVAAGLLYIASNQRSNKNGNGNGSEGFKNKGRDLYYTEDLPNTDIPNRNYPNEYPVVVPDTDLTSKLSTDNRYDGPSVYTDKFFNPAVNNNVFNPGAPMNPGSINGTPDAAAASSTYYSMAGQQVDNNYFRHNNMVPYFGSHVRSRTIAETANESIMDNYTGTGTQIYTKKEQAPLFSPGDNYQYAYGAPNQTDFFQSRVNPSSKMSNVKPFEEIHVAPGLGLGYSSEGSAGFNSGMLARDQWREKTVDELRVANNPKASGYGLYGHEGPAISNITMRGNHGIQEKNRPDGSFEMGQDRWFTTTGAEKGQMLNPIPVDRFVNRPETTTDYAGGAGFGQSSTYVDGEYMPTHNQQLGQVPLSIASAQGRSGAREGEYGLKGTMAYPNNRTSNYQDNYFGLMGGSLGAVVAPLLDLMRPSRKENAVGNLRPYQNPSSLVPLPTIYDPTDVPAATIREMTEKSKFHMNVNANQLGGAYKVTEQQAIDNNRQHQSDFYYAGNSSAGERGREPRPYDAEYRQRNNDIKASTIDGRLVKGNMSLLNSDINMQAKAKDAYMINHRAVAPMMPSEAPSIQNMGRLQGKDTLYQGMQMDRTTPDVMSQLKGNPYALSVTGGI